MTTPAATSYTILVIDDNRELLQLITESLTLLGDYTVLTADNGADGLAYAVEYHPDCAIIDVKMPGLDGYQLVRALRGDADTAAIPLVMLTALVQDHYRFAGLLVGADRYLTKPIKPADLLTAIQEAIQINQSERLKRAQALLDTPDAPSEPS
ncbi:MAG: response regulator [Ktedonobacterales bacterium]